MQIDWPSVFSVFNAPKISRAIRGSDTRNIRLPGDCFRHPWGTPRYGRSARSDLDAIFSVQNLKTETLALTSASIVKAGLNKVWLTESKGSFHSEHGSRIPSVSLQKAVNKKKLKQKIIHTPRLEPISAQLAAAPIPTTRLSCPESSQRDSEPIPKPFTPIDHHLFKSVETFGRILQPKLAPILTRLPMPRTCQPERESYTLADPQHPSGSRFLSFSLQKAVNEPISEQSIVHPPNLEASRAFSSLPHPATAPPLAHLFMNDCEPEFNFNDIFSRQILESFATNGSESTRQHVWLNLFSARQDLFYLPSVSSPQVTLFNQFSDTFPLAKSLLFLPPSPPSKKFIFNPFSPEEDILPLPPAPEPQSPQFGIPYPVRSPDHKFPVSPPTDCIFQDYIVPYPSLSPTQASDVLSPLSIPLLLFPAAPPPFELILKIAGPEGYLNADHHKLTITQFLLSRATEFANSLVIFWQLSHVDSGGARGLISLKALFTQLDEKILGSDRTALSSFSKLSITIPDLVKDAAPYNDFLQPVKQDDSIDLTNAVGLVEFTWHGDFIIFASKFKSLSFATLTCLSMKSSHMSIEDAITLLHSCLDLETASLGTMQNKEDCDTVLPLKPYAVQRKVLPRLARLTLESNIPLHPLIMRIRWTGQISLNFTLRNQGTINIHKLPLPWVTVSNIELNCHLTAQELFHMKRVFPSVRYHDNNI